jgi:hypothetical protein
MIGVLVAFNLLLLSVRWAKWREKKQREQQQEIEEQRYTGQLENNRNNSTRLHKIEKRLQSRK